MTSSLRILLLADSHLGFDLPERPRIARRCRGHDFLANYATALEPAVRGEVDVVIHGGDVFDTPVVHASVAWQAFQRLIPIADAGIPVFIVPGNHERARMPHARFAMHPRIHVFDRARTFVIDVRGKALALAGFPFARRVRARFVELLHETGWKEQAADVRVLCLHQCVEGATVGPGNFVFTRADDVIRTRDVPADFAAVLSGHIHRRQVLTEDLRGRPLGTPVLYPGSIERTSFAEIGEEKGFMIVHLSRDVRWQFRPLPSRPMLVRDVTAEGRGPAALVRDVCDAIAAVPPDAVLRIRIRGEVSDEQLRAIAVARVRSLAPPAMNIEIAIPDRATQWRRPGPRPAGGEADLQLCL